MKRIADLEFIVSSKSPRQVQDCFDDLMKELKAKYVSTLRDGYGKIVPLKIHFRVKMYAGDADKDTEIDPAESE